MANKQDLLQVIPSHSSFRGKHAEHLVAGLFTSHGWKIETPSMEGGGGSDRTGQRGAQRFAVEVKAIAEGRADRVIPLLAQAILQAQTHALDAGNAQPLAVICVETASASLLNQVRAFVKKYASDVPFGIVSKSGLRHFQGPALEELNAELEAPRPRGHGGSSASGQIINLFSDLNQWMLKVLLAPEVPEHLLGAPRQAYQSGSELAAAARVSNMSASRFLQQLRNEGHLDDSSRHLVLVRRAELFRRWRATTMRPPPERPMRFLLRAPVQQQIRGLLNNHQDDVCLGLFAAAEALRLGHVSGVPPHVCVPRLPRSNEKNWRMLMDAPSEAPDIVLRQALFPQSTFRGAVHRDGLIVADVIQVWLDVAHHPARGEEQAELIYQKVLRPIVEN